MSRTENFRKQHVEIMNLARDINGLLSNTMGEQEASAVRPLLSKLAGLVQLHLAMEDKALYPRLQDHPDPAARGIAKRYQDEMGSIGAAFGNYIATWRTSTQMAADPARFTSDSKAIFNALSKRIHHENTELYPLLDKLAS